MAVHGNPRHAIFTILWFGMLYFYHLKLVGRIGIQQRSRYHLFLNSTLIMMVNVFYCVQVRFFGQVVGMHISCIWMSLFKWGWIFLPRRLTACGLDLLWGNAVSPLWEKQNNNRNKRCQSQCPTGVVLDRKKDWRRGWVYSEMCFVCVTLELAGLFESPTFRLHQREDKIGSYLNMATGEHKPTFAQVFHECNLVFQRTSNCAEEMAASA